MVGCTTTATLVCATLLATPAQGAPNNNSVAKLTKAVTLAGLMEHLEEFQAIADANGGNRAAGQPGYAASVDYVVERLEAAGYDPTVQEFTFTSYEESSALERLAPDPRTFQYGSEFLENAFDSGTPEGTASGPLAVVPNGGCVADDFAGFPDGAIALVQRGTCAFAVKALNAEDAGAAGAIIWNNTTGMVSMVGDATGLTIPVVFASQQAGQDLASTPGATVTVTVEGDERTAWNVLAETRAGNDDNVVMAGAHLDSVLEGAGINDNATGSAALLEVAEQMAKVKPNNTVRFAWWGAEEEGLLGAEHYVAQLSDEEVSDIALYLNFDMIGSPNYMFGVYDGDESGFDMPDGFVPEGSAQIEDVFESFYAERGLPYQDSEFSGRSDYGPFIAVGIPAGGLFTGAEGVKTEAEAAKYGGVAGASYDPCYHAFCDNLRGDGQDEELYDQLRADYDLVGNVNTFAFDINADAVAAAVITFAFDTSSVNGVRAPGKSHGAGKSAEAHQDRHDMESVG